MIKSLSKQKSKTKKAKISKQKVITISLSVAICAMIVLIVINPKLCIESVYNGLAVWAKCVLPSLLPFMFFTKILSDLNVVSKISKKCSKLTKFLFNAPSVSAYIFLMSVISGYPVGAKLISEFYEAKIITEKQANKLTTFCSTSGPLFIIGSVGTAMFLNAKIGYIIFISHILSSILNGIIYRNIYKDNYEQEFTSDQKSLNYILPNSMSSSVTSVMIVGGYIAIAFMLVDLANSLNLLAPINHFFALVLKPFGLNSEIANAISSGIIEISKGCSMLSILDVPKIWLATLASFIISFGGFSVFFQSITFLSKCKVNMKFYLLQKLTHGLLSGIVTFLICLLVL